MKHSILLVSALFIHSLLAAQPDIQFEEGGWEEVRSCVQCEDCDGRPSDVLEESKRLSFFLGEEKVDDWRLIRIHWKDCDRTVYRTGSENGFNIGASEFTDAHTALADIFREVRHFTKEARNLRRRPSPYEDYSLHVIRHFFDPYPEAEEPSPAEKSKPLLTADQMPLFPGCEEVADQQERKICADRKMVQFVYGNLVYPAEARANGVEGMVVVRFTVRADGTVGDLAVVRDIGSGCGEAAMNVIQLMNDLGMLWEPGRMAGEPVDVQFTLPVKFRL